MRTRRRKKSAREGMLDISVACHPTDSEDVAVRKAAATLAICAVRRPGSSLRSE